METCGFCAGMRKDDTRLRMYNQIMVEVRIKEMIKDKFMWARFQDYNLSREDMLEQLEKDVLEIISKYFPKE